MLISRSPVAGLRPFVMRLWAIEDDGTPAGASGPLGREHVLPTGAMHLAFRLSGPPLRLYRDAGHRAGETIGHEIVGGVRPSFYLRDIPGGAVSIGAQLLPGASRHLFGAPAGDLAGRHTPLADLWGSAAGEASSRLLAASGAGRRLDRLESLLLARLAGAAAIPPVVAHAIERLGGAARVGDVVRETGWSHRRFIADFRRTTGLAPKTWCRLLRFQRVIRRAADPGASWAGIALDAGYSDQQHMHREFRQFAGVTPGEYRALAPPRSHHVPVP